MVTARLALEVAWLGVKGVAARPALMEVAWPEVKEVDCAVPSRAPDIWP